MKKPRKFNEQFYVRLDEVARIGQRAVQAAQEESRRMGVPNVYSINGILHWELPNGELSTKDPMAISNKDSKKKLPASLGAGRSGRGDVGQRAEELLDGMGKGGLDGQKT